MPKSISVTPFGMTIFTKDLQFAKTPYFIFVILFEITMLIRDTQVPNALAHIGISLNQKL